MPGNIVPQGLPFYSGSITYELDQPVEGKVSVTLDEMTAAVCMLHGDTDEIIAFAPYEAAVTGLKSIEMVFNRRNTFGRSMCRFLTGEAMDRTPS